MWRYSKEQCRIRFYLWIEPRKSFKTSVLGVEVGSKQYLCSENILMKFCIGILLSKHFSSWYFYQFWKRWFMVLTTCPIIGLPFNVLLTVYEGSSLDCRVFPPVSCERTVSLCKQKKNKTESRNGINHCKCEHSSFSLDISTCSESVQWPE